MAVNTQSDTASISPVSSSIGDQEKAYRPEVPRTASEEGYTPDGLERRLSESMIGGDEISHAFDEEEEKEFDAEGQNGAAKKGAEAANGAGLNRQPTKHGFFDSSISSHRLSWGLEFLKNYVLLIAFMLTAFSLYWGSFYGRQNRYVNLKVLIVNADNETISGINPYLGESMTEARFNPEIATLGGWEVKTPAEVQVLADAHGITVEEEVKRLVHHQQYWGGIYIVPNATYSYYEAWTNKDTSFNSSGQFVHAYYETGRDLLAVQSYLSTFMKAYQTAWIANLTESFFTPLLNSLSTDEKTDLITDAPALITTLPTWDLLDMRPASSTVLVAPYQVGAIYLIIITFFQFNFFAGVHQKVSQHLRLKHFIAYRLISSQISYLILSLGYACVSAAFQVDFNMAYKGGFGVYWMMSYLSMSAVGGANENMAMICFATYPPCLGFWILSWVVLNISPTFSALALTSPFYRYGYMMPIHNSVEAMKVIFFNTYRGELGRNIGILIAWIVINNLLMPLVMKFFAAQMRKKAQAGGPK